MSITAQFEFDEAEYRLALRELLGPMRWTIILGGIVLPLVALWFGVLRPWGEITIEEAVATVLPWVLLGAFFVALAPVLTWAQARKARALDPSLNGTQVREVGDAGLQILGAGYAPTLAWSDIERARETAHFFFFFEDKRVWHFIPKRVLTDIERDELRNLIQARSQP
jgi:hypothetical protein